MFNEDRIFNETDPDFPTTLAMRVRLAEAGKVAPPIKAQQTEDTRSPKIPMGVNAAGDTVYLDLNQVMASRLLVQGVSGAGKSKTLRHLIEECHDYLPVMIIDPEGEFGNLAAHIGAVTLPAGEIASDGLTAAAVRAKHHRIPIHLDLSDLDPDVRIQKAAAFFAGLLSTPKEDWQNTVLVVIDEAQLLAPQFAASARDAEIRRLGVSTLTELCSRGRKRGIGVVVGTFRLAKLDASVVSTLYSFLIGRNVYDRDVKRAGEILGLSPTERQDLLALKAGQFYAIGPALTTRRTLIRIMDTVTEHLGFTPELTASACLSDDEAKAFLDLEQLPKSNEGRADLPVARRGGQHIDGFLLHPHALTAVLLMNALRKISPNATTSEELRRHLNRSSEDVDAGLDLLSRLGAVDSMPKGTSRIARLSARLRTLVVEPPVVSLS